MKNMVELRTNVIAKTNIQTPATGAVCRSEVLRLIYERKHCFSARVRQCDIDDILEELNLMRSESQTVESK